MISSIIFPQFGHLAFLESRAIMLKPTRYERFQSVFWMRCKQFTAMCFVADDMNIRGLGSCA